MPWRGVWCHQQWKNLGNPGFLTTFCLSQVREAMSREDVQAVRRAVEDLQQAAQAMAQHLHGRQTAGAGTQTPGGDGG
jgi:hypothetical protein